VERSLHNRRVATNRALQFEAAPEGNHDCSRIAFHSNMSCAPSPFGRVTTYLTHLIKLIACCAEGARCNSPAQRAGGRSKDNWSAESAQCDHLSANLALHESGALEHT